MPLSLPPSPRIQLSPQMLHLSIPHPFSDFSGISATMSAERTKWAAIASVGENKGISFVLCTSILFSNFRCHVLFLSLISLRTQASDYNIFEGLECRGGPALVLSQGRVVYEDGNLQVQQGTGRFIPRKQFPDYAYQRVKCRNQVWHTHKLLLRDHNSCFIMITLAVLLEYFLHVHTKIYNILLIIWYICIFLTLFKVKRIYKTQNVSRKSTKTSYLQNDPGKILKMCTLQRFNTLQPCLCKHSIVID